MQENLTTRLRNNSSTEDDVEIVVVSDTVRQRRSRTPQSSSIPSPMPSNPRTKEEVATINLPDILPTTFRLTESSSLFFGLSNPVANPSLDGSETAQPFSVVEVRELNMMLPSKPLNTTVDARIRTPLIGEIIRAGNIFESADYFEPDCVEVIHIVDATSEPSDSECPTPNGEELSINSERLSTTSSDNSGDYEIEENQFELFEPISLEYCPNFPHKYRGDATRKRLTPTLKDILTERDCFYNYTNKTTEEPLVFSDDDDDDNNAHPSCITAITVFILYTVTQTHFDFIGAIFLNLRNFVYIPQCFHP